MIINSLYKRIFFLGGGPYINHVIIGQIFLIRKSLFQSLSVRFSGCEHRLVPKSRWGCIMLDPDLKPMPIRLMTLQSSIMYDIKTPGKKYHGNEAFHKLPNLNCCWPDWITINSKVRPPPQVFDTAQLCLEAIFQLKHLLANGFYYHLLSARFGNPSESESSNHQHILHTSCTEPSICRKLRSRATVFLWKVSVSYSNFG